MISESLNSLTITFIAGEKNFDIMLQLTHSVI